MILIFIEEAIQGFWMQVTPSEATRMMNWTEAVALIGQKLSLVVAILLMQLYT